ncbi:MAG: mannose-1-phosphate guanylyltransferase/mannose-6-phosphate isomerase [Alphaproteobacteria bacterium]|nr:MAG: mannose-1-phosphate guanylyltransferase/mannose-6-phosphate isomerase [Alphaproteobacteria bacterium]
MPNTRQPPLVRPVILSGGVGSRLWPLSRALYPKQLLPLVGERTMLQETLNRVADPALFAPPMVICNEEHRFIIAEQMRQNGTPAGTIVLEPEGRNTAPAAAIGALLALRDDDDALILILPSDHVIGDVTGFHAAVTTAKAAAQDGALVTFGMEPDQPETGYGYIRRGDPLPGIDGCYRVARFIEKPQAEAARAMLAEGGWLWNSGMFLFGARAYLEELERLQPGMAQQCRQAVAHGTVDLDFFRLDAAAFKQMPSNSIDYAVMERTTHAAVVPADIQWNDIGSWSALWQIGAKNADGNVTIGDIITEATRDSYIRSEGPLVAAIGVRDLLVVATEDAILVAAKDRSQDVKTVVERLKAAGRQQHHAHVRVVRPWGSYQSVDAGNRFQVKQLVVKPGAKLSLQKHRHRAEHWVVVSGTARVTRDAETFDLHVDESTYIPVGAAHRLENPGDEPLRVIEVQSGDYLGEDDIIRFDDVYGRVEEKEKK